jgi:hypothetical protein
LLQWEISVPDAFSPPFPNAQAGAFLGLAAVGGLLIFSSAEAELKVVATLGSVVGTVGVLGVFRLVQRHILAIFNARYTRLADVSVASLGLGVLLSLWYSWREVASLGWLATGCWWVGIATICVSIGLVILGLVGQARVALKRPERH